MPIQCLLQFSQPEKIPQKKKKQKAHKEHNNLIQDFKNTLNLFLYRKLCSTIYEHPFLTSGVIH